MKINNIRTIQVRTVGAFAAQARAKWKQMEKDAPCTAELFKTRWEVFIDLLFYEQVITPRAWMKLRGNEVKIF